MKRTDKKSLLSTYENLSRRSYETFALRIDIAQACFFFYEVNAWIGGPGNRVIILHSFAGHQPSLDAIWLSMFSGLDMSDLSDIYIEFSFQNYHNVDQAKESADLRVSVQKILAFLVLACAGDACISIFSSQFERMVSIDGDLITFFFENEEDRKQVANLLAKYGIL